MVSLHFDRNEFTSFLGAGYKILPDFIIFASPGIELDYIGVKKELKKFADLNSLDQYDYEIEFAYAVGIYLGNGPANVQGIAISYFF